VQARRECRCKLPGSQCPSRPCEREGSSWDDCPPVILERADEEDAADLEDDCCGSEEQEWQRGAGWSGMVWRARMWGRLARWSRIARRSLWGKRKTRQAIK
jgi:hypothetical protein